MEYNKIIDLTVKAQIKHAIIYELYRIIGANSKFDDDTQKALYAAIEDHKKDLEKIETKLNSLTEVKS